MIFACAHKLENHTILKLTPVYVDGELDFWNLETDSYSIGFFNPLYFGSEKIRIEHVPFLLGKKITKATYKEKEHLKLLLENQSFLLLSVRPEDFHGPEAAECNFKSGEIVIFDQDE
ncbi:hypothetical protein JJB07_09760 [Tumebacillus sp. ITR2]|uniref:Uncharacterized protein n=1 Tax=Tumebacillus amylolyticus TaxID=2801339 RepID=A0ABS1J9K3_9BACL|nr:hypothetical protein [Tumebacillus amylolyticus]MBL0386939.1 hypothetical protein [Tumebacillus amylolyticus]